MYCSQYQHHLKAKKDVLNNTTSVEQSQQRNVSKNRVHQCGGFLSIGVKKNESVTVRIGHKVNHESASDSYELSPQTIDRIEELSNHGMSPFQICTVLQSEGQDVLWNRVYYRWTVIQQIHFLKHSDAFLSCREYLLQCQNLMLIYQSEKPWALGFLTLIGVNLSGTHACTEVLIDSTHKTNSSRFELFTVIVRCIGVGFLLAFLFFEGNYTFDASVQQTKDVLLSFLTHIRNHMESLRPKFFFNDTGMGQIHAIKNSYNITPSICKWHMKRVVRTKVLSLQRGGKARLNDAEYLKLQTLLTSHYCLHPIFSEDCLCQRYGTKQYRSFSLF